MADEPAVAREHTQDIALHAWQCDRLVACGVPDWRAVVLAGLVDYHRLEELVSAGCPVETAVDILRP